MSAFVVSNGHIATILATVIGNSREGASWDGGKFTRDNAQVVGQILLDENVRSYNHRYAHHGAYEAPPFAFVLTSAKVVSPIAAIKLIHCLEYQSCECPDWETTEAKRCLDALASVLIRCIPEYQVALYSLD